MQRNMDSLLASEREFHDRRYLDGDDRLAQLKYYWSVDKGNRRFTDQLRNLAGGRDILEYGCGAESRAGELAGLYKSYSGIDISETAIARLQKRHASLNTTFHVMDAMNMSFPGESFDLVFGSGIVHHLDTDLCGREVSRVLRPGGIALFWEPLGNNPLINAYRWMTPSARTPDEHPLVGRDFSIMKHHFRSVETELYGLTSLAAVPFRNSSFGPGMRDFLVRVDELLLRMPGVRSMAWYSIMRCIK